MSWENQWGTPLNHKKNPRKHEEDDEQIKVAVYLDKRNILFYAVPNGGRRSMSEAVKFKRTGVKPGVPDLCIAEPRGSYHGLYIEMKKEKGGVTSEAQLYWMEQLNKKGYKAVVCKGAAAAIIVIEEYFR